MKHIWSSFTLTIVFALLLATIGCNSSEPDATGSDAIDMPYVASALRDPYHKNTCRWAQKINPQNLQGFETEQAAVNAGHRPCKVCNP